MLAVKWLVKEGGVFHLGNAESNISSTSKASMRSLALVKVHVDSASAERPEYPLDCLAVNAWSMLKQNLSGVSLIERCMPRITDLVHHRLLTSILPRKRVVELV